MKKSLLALSVATLIASNIASATTIYEKDGNALDVYGRIQGVVYSTHEASDNNYQDSSLQTSGRLGVNARTNLTAGIDAFANLEWDAADGKGHDSFEARYAFIGLDFGSYGLFKAGRFEDAVKYVLGATDIFDDFGTKGFVNDEKLDGLFMYSLSNNSFDLNLSFQTAQNKQSVSYYQQEIDVDHAYSASVGYTSPDVWLGPISIKTGYSYTKGQAESDNINNSTPNFDEMNIWATSFSWGNVDNGFYIAGLYNEKEMDFRSYPPYNLTDYTYNYRGHEAVLGYAFNNGVSIRAGYNYIERKIIGVKYKVSVAPVYLNYQINPSFNIWSEARFNIDHSSDDINNFPFDVVSDTNLSENVYSVGARYTF